MTLSKKIVFSAAATSVNIVSGFVRNKIFALYLTVSLFGILSLGQQMLGLVFTLFAFGLPLGMSLYGAKLSTLTPEEQQRGVSSLLLFILQTALFLTIAVAVVVVWFPAAVGLAVANSEEYSFALAVLLFAAPLMVVHNCLSALMEGMGLVEEIVVFKIVPALINLPLMYLLVSASHFEGAAYGIVASEFVTMLFALFLLRKKFRFVAGSFSLRKVFGEVGTTAVLSVVVGFGTLAIDFLVKRYLLGAFGETSNGIVQSVAKIVDLYPTVVLSWMTIHLFPLMSASVNDKQQVVGHLERAANIAVAIVVPVIFVLWLFREPVLKILYTHDFLIAEHYFAAMLTTGIVKVLSWSVGVALLPLGMKKGWFWTSLLFPAVFAVAVACGGIIDAGIYIIPIATMIALLFQYGSVMFLFRSKGFRFTSGFGFQNLLYLLIVVSLVAAFWWEWTAMGAVIIYIYVIVRFELWHEIKDKILTYAGKTS